MLFRSLKLNETAAILRAKGEPVIHLGGGEPKTKPPIDALVAAAALLSSGEVRLAPAECMATVGAVSNPDNQNTVVGKAGRQRWLGFRPVVRGVAMNPVDHPLGGGEGKTSGGRHPVTPWGQPTKGYKTRRRKTTDRFIVQRRTK